MWVAEIEINWRSLKFRVSKFWSQMLARILHSPRIMRNGRTGGEEGEPDARVWPMGRNDWEVRWWWGEDGMNFRKRHFVSILRNVSEQEKYNTTNWLWSYMGWRRRSSLSGGYSETKVLVFINLNVNLKPDTDSLIGKRLGLFESTFLLNLLFHCKFCETQIQTKCLQWKCKHSNGNVL